MHTQYQPGRGPHAARYYIDVFTRRHPRTDQLHVSGRGGDECCECNLHRTGCRPLHDHEGSPREGTKDVPSCLFRPVCASRRVASPRGASCTLRILHTKRIRTLNGRLSAGAGLYCESSRVGEQRFQQRNVRTTIGRSTEIAFCPRERKWFRSLEGMPLLSRFATMRLRTITASLKLRTHDDINGIPTYFTSISELLGFGSTAIEIEWRGNHRIINGNGANSHYCSGHHQLLFDADARLLLPLPPPFPNHFLILNINRVLITSER